MKKFIICLLLVFTQLLPITAFASNYSINTELNPEFEEYISGRSLKSSDGDTGDYIAPAMSLVSPSVLSAPSLPASYDSRNSDRIYYSGLGQGSDGVCWSFASCLATETAIKDKFGEFFNLSEQHLRYSETKTGGNPYGYERGPSDGGNFRMFEVYSGSWRGPVLETDDPYVSGEATRTYSTTTATKKAAFHVTDTIDIPNVATDVSTITAEQKRSHIEEVKQYIYKYGCCFSSMYWNSSYNNYTTKSYFNKSNMSSSNHAIALIGWDDNYSKDNFTTKPSENGAFIVKNSQSATGYYMYLSYEDVRAGWDVSCVTGVDDIYDYGNHYNYNYFEPGASYNKIPGNEKSRTTNVFTTEYDDEELTAVGVYTRSRNMNYTVYASKTATGNESNETKFTQLASGKLEMPGMHTIKLSEGYALGDKGTKYAVRVVYTADSEYEVPLERNITNFVTQVKTVAGRCYFSREGYVVTDVGAEEQVKANLYVQAYTDATYTVSVPFAGTSGFENLKYRINNGDQKSATTSIKVGLNDEITFDFTNTTSGISNYKIGSEEVSINDNKISFTVDKDVTFSSMGKSAISVSFDVNGGNETYETIQTTVDTEFTLPKDSPTKSGCTFAGWQDSESNTYFAGNTVSFKKSETLKAKWTPKVGNGSCKLQFKAYKNGTLVDKLYAGYIYEIAVCAKDISDYDIYGVNIKLGLTDAVALVTDDGYLANDVADAVKASSPFAIDSSSTFDSVAGELKMKLKPSFVLLTSPEQELFRVRIMPLYEEKNAFYVKSNDFRIGWEDKTATVSLPTGLDTIFELIENVNMSSIDNDATFSGDLSLGGNKKMILSAYKGDMLVGLKIINCTEDSGAFNYTVNCSDTPQMLKLLVWDNFTSIAPVFSVIEHKLN